MLWFDVMPSLRLLAVPPLLAIAALLALAIGLMAWSDQCALPGRQVHIAVYAPDLDVRDPSRISLDHYPRAMEMALQPQSNGWSY